MLKLLKRLLGVGKRKKKLKAGYIVIDLSDDGGIWIGNTFIPQKNILNIDTERKTIVYKDIDGTIKEASYKDAKPPS